MEITRSFTGEVDQSRYEGKKKERRKEKVSKSCCQDYLDGHI